MSAIESEIDRLKRIIQEQRPANRSMGEISILCESFEYAEIDADEFAKAVCRIVEGWVK